MSEPTSSLPPDPDAASTAQYVIEVTSQSFARDVLERSREVPVVVDFWATWCAPCRQLGPVLEGLAREHGGKFVLAKVDTDRAGEVAAQFGVRSIPAVFGVRDGAVVDGFVGVQSEAVIRRWLERLLPTEAESLAAVAREFEVSDPAGAEAKYAEALRLQPDLPQAEIGLARLALADNRIEEAASRIAALERRGFLEPEGERLKAELTLRTSSRNAGGVEAARAALAASPRDLAAKFALAEALVAAGQYPEALELCLDLVERDRRGVGEQARQTMVAIFQLLPPESELVTEYQRQLSLVL